MALRLYYLLCNLLIKVLVEINIFSINLKIQLRKIILLLGKVIGTVWSTRKDEKLVGSKFLIVKQMNLEGKITDNFVVAVDSVGAGVGETVLFASGSSARQTIITKDKPVDAVIMAIVDKLDISVKD